MERAADRPARADNFTRCWLNNRSSLWSRFFFPHWAQQLLFLTFSTLIKKTINISTASIWHDLCAWHVFHRTKPVREGRREEGKRSRGDKRGRKTCLLCWIHLTKLRAPVTSTSGQPLLYISYPPPLIFSFKARLIFKTQAITGHINHHQALLLQGDVKENDPSIFKYIQ